MKSLNPTLMAALLVTLTFGGAYAANSERRAEVAKQGAEVMPFNLQDTTHVFIKTPSGGIQRVIAKSRTNTQQIALVREHLRAIRAQFANGDFSGPTHVHGEAMPGLHELKAAAPGQIDVQYRDVEAGGELTYRCEDKSLITALHEWFDAQLSDHGADAKAGEVPHHHHDTPMKE